MTLLSSEGGKDSHTKQVQQEIVKTPVHMGGVFVFYLSYTLGETGGGKFVLGWGDGETIFLFCMISQTCSCCRHCMLCLVHVTMQALLSKE